MLRKKKEAVRYGDAVINELSDEMARPAGLPGYGTVIHL